MARLVIFVWGLFALHRASCHCAVYRRPLVKTPLAPAVKRSVDQMIRNRVVLGDMLMALLAFPRALEDICYLFEYSCHCVLRKCLPGSFHLLLFINRATVRQFDTCKRD